MKSALNLRKTNFEKTILFSFLGWQKKFSINFKIEYTMIKFIIYITALIISFIIFLFVEVKAKMDFEKRNIKYDVLGTTKSKITYTIASLIGSFLVYCLIVSILAYKFNLIIY